VLRGADGAEVFIDDLEDPVDLPGSSTSTRRRPIHADSDLLYQLLWHNNDLLPSTARDSILQLPASPLRWFALAKLYGLLRYLALGRLRAYAAETERDLAEGKLVTRPTFSSDYGELLRRVVDEAAPPARWSSPQFLRCPTPLMINRKPRDPCTSTWWCPYCYVREAFKLYKALKYTPVVIRTESHVIYSVDDYQRIRSDLDRNALSAKRRTGRRPDALIWLRWWPLPESICDPINIHDQLDVITLTLGGDPLCAQSGNFVRAFSYPVGWLTVEEPRRVCYILNQTWHRRNRLVQGSFGDFLYEP
jgi:hypothetical protein